MPRILAVLLLAPCLLAAPLGGAAASTSCTTDVLSLFSAVRTSAAADSTDVYIFGGQAGTSYNAPLLDSITRVLPTGATVTVAHLSEAKAGVGVVWAGSVFLVFGGFTSFYSGGGGTTSSRIEAFDPANGAVWTVGFMPTATGHAAVGIHAGEVYLFGGDTGRANLASIAIYNVSTGAWSSSGASFTSGRSGSAASWDGSGSFYVFGGHGNDGRHTDEIARYWPANDTLLTLNVHLAAPTAGGGAALNAVHAPGSPADPTITFYGGHAQDSWGNSVGSVATEQVLRLGTGALVQSASRLPMPVSSFGIAQVGAIVKIVGGSNNAVPALQTVTCTSA